MAETIEELQSYREKVIAEVERRMMRLRAIETDIERAEFEVESQNRSHTLLSRDTGRNQAAAAHRKRLRERVETLRKERGQAEEDLERAKARLEEVDERMAEFEPRSDTE